MPLGLAGCIRTPSASAAFDVSAPISDGAPVQGVSAVAATRRSRVAECADYRSYGTRKISPLGTYHGTEGEKGKEGLTGQSQPVHICVPRM